MFSSHTPLSLSLSLLYKFGQINSSINKLGFTNKIKYNKLLNLIQWFFMLYFNKALGFTNKIKYNKLLNLIQWFFMLYFNKA